MKKVESQEDFYKGQNVWMPDTLQKDIGHFNVFVLEPFVGVNAKPVPYQRRDYYKIALVNGNAKVHFADKVIEVKKHALVFRTRKFPMRGNSVNGLEAGS